MKLPFTFDAFIASVKEKIDEDPRTANVFVNDGMFRDYGTQYIFMCDDKLYVNAMYSQVKKCVVWNVKRLPPRPFTAGVGATLEIAWSNARL